VKPWLFLMPDQVKSPAAGVFKYTDAIDTVYQAADEYAKLKYEHNWDTADTVGFVAMKHALKYLPVLGEFYSAALSLFINLDGELFWKNYTDRKDARIRRAIYG